MSSQQPISTSPSYFYIKGDNNPPIADNSMTPWLDSEHLDTQSEEKTQSLSSTQNIDLFNALGGIGEPGNHSLYALEQMSSHVDSGDMLKTSSQETLVTNEQYMSQYECPGYQYTPVQPDQYQTRLLSSNPALNYKWQYINYQNDLTTTSGGNHPGLEYSHVPMIYVVNDFYIHMRPPAIIFFQPGAHYQTVLETAPSIPSHGRPDHERHTVQLPQQNHLSTPSDDREKPCYICRCGKSVDRKDNYKRHIRTCPTCKNPHVLDSFICVCSQEFNASTQDMINHVEGCNPGRRGRRPRAVS
ncbi:hypothetical protein F5X96DRAFT_632232 [Biscogniauxia mediterranea]|nr:hypothetical protein F5X96DRAFT_632232 [Biscogniauxia mediterranea]